jgi:hypothetical protein
MEISKIFSGSHFRVLSEILILSFSLRFEMSSSSAGEIKKDMQLEQEYRLFLPASRGSKVAGVWHKGHFPFCSVGFGRSVLSVIIF